MRTGARGFHQGQEPTGSTNRPDTLPQPCSPSPLKCLLQRRGRPYIYREQFWSIVMRVRSFSARQFEPQSRTVTGRNVVMSTLLIVLAAASLKAAQNVIEKEKLEVEKARVYVTTVQPHRPVLAPRGHTTNRVFIYMDDGVMTRREGDSPAKTIVFHRGDIGWIPGSSGYVSE